MLEQHRKAMAAESLKAGRSMPETVFVNEPAKAKKSKQASERGGKPMDPSKIRRAHELALKEAGLRHIRIHDLRGTYTALMERYIQRETVRNANQMRTEGIEDETPLSGESVTA